MISIPNPKSIILKIIEYKAKYIKEHGHPPNLIYLDAGEREDLRKWFETTVWNWPADKDFKFNKVAGMEIRKEEDFIIKTDRFKVI